MTKPKINRTGADVKASRSYSSPTRDEQALGTRRRIRAAAEELFLAGGYGATSMTAIAAAAGVSRPTVFNVFGNKIDLLKEIADVRLAGDDAPVDVVSRPLGQQMMTATDPEELLRVQARYTAEIMERIAPILVVLTEAAAVDADAAALVGVQEEGRLFGMGLAVDRLVEIGALRPGLDPMRAKESIWLLSGLEPWRLAQRRDWSTAEYEGWFLECARALLLGGTD